MSQPSGNHEHYVGKGTADKMRELDDTPATCEKYPFGGEQASEVSMAWGVSGRLYVYIKQIDKVEVYETLDISMAGGNP